MLTQIGTVAVSGQPIGTPTITIPAGGVAAGTRIIIPWAAGGGWGSATIAITDSRGNTYAADAYRGPNGIGVGAYAVGVVSGLVTTALQAGDTISFGGFSSKNTGFAAIAYCATGINTSTPVRNASGADYHGSDATGGITGTNSVSANAGDLVFNAILATNCGGHVPTFGSESPGGDTVGTPISGPNEYNSTDNAIQAWWGSAASTGTQTPSATITVPSNPTFSLVSIAYEGPSTPTAPDAPAGVMATTTTLSGTAPNPLSANSLTYDVWLYSGGVWAATSQLNLAAGAAWSIPGLTAGTSYQVRYRAQNASGSTDGAPLTVYTLCATPGGFHATGGVGGVAFGWNAVAGAVSYTIDKSPAGAGTWTTLASGLTGTSTTQTPPTYGDSYDYRIKAVNPAGSSAASAISTATATAPPVPVPAGVSAAQSLVSNTPRIVISGTD